MNHLFRIEPYATREQFLDVLEQLAHQSPIDDMERYAMQVDQLLLNNQKHWPLLGIKLRQQLRLISRKLMENNPTEKIQGMALRLLGIAMQPPGPDETWEKVRELMTAKASKEQVEKAFSAFEAAIEKGSGVAYGHVVLNAVYASFFLQDYKKAQAYLYLATVHLFERTPHLPFDRNYSLVLAATQVAIELFLRLEPPLLEEESDQFRELFLHNDFLSIIRFFSAVFFKFHIDGKALLKDNRSPLPITADQMQWKMLPIILNKNNVYKKEDDSLTETMIVGFLEHEFLNKFLSWFILNEKELEINPLNPKEQTRKLKDKKDEDLLTSQIYLELVFFIVKSLKEILGHASKPSDYPLDEAVKKVGALLNKIKEERNQREVKQLFEDLKDLEEKPFSSTSSSEKKKNPKKKPATSTPTKTSAKEFKELNQQPPLPHYYPDDQQLPFMTQGAARLSSSPQKGGIKPLPEAAKPEAPLLSQDSFPSLSDIKESSSLSSSLKNKKARKRKQKKEAQIEKTSEPINLPEEKRRLSSSTDRELKVDSPQISLRLDPKQQLLNQLQYLPSCILQLFSTFEENTLFLTGITIPEMYLEKKPSAYHLLTFCSAEEILKRYPSGVVEGKKEFSRISVILEGIKIYIKPFLSKPGFHHTIRLKENNPYLFYKIQAIFVKVLPHATEIIDLFGGLADLEAGVLEFVNGKPQDIFYKHPLNYLQACLLAAELKCTFSPRIEEEMAKVKKSISLFWKETDIENIQLLSQGFIESVGREQVLSILEEVLEEQFPSILNSLKS